MSRLDSPTEAIEVVPAILRKSFEKIRHDWEQVAEVATHVHLDVADGVFAGDATWQDIARFAELGDTPLMELHMMVQRPADFVEAVIELAPGRCIWHLKVFADADEVRSFFQYLRGKVDTELALALNIETSIERLEPLLDVVDYVLFMGIDPGFTSQPLVASVFKRISQFKKSNPDMTVAVDGAVSKKSIERYARSGARQFCAHSSIFGEGDPKENMEQLRLLAEAAIA